VKRAAMTALLVDDPAVIAAYDRYHADVWPEVRADNERCGARRIFIFRDGRRLFMFLEGVDDFDIDSFGERMGEGHPRTLEWLKMTASFMEPVQGGAPDLQWTVLQEICALESAAPHGAATT
jgi:L-rhamnose mutarotase